MREATEQTRQLIADGGFDARYVADLVYDGERRLSDVTLARDGVSLSWNAGQFVAGSGQARIVWADDFATSALPERVGDMFAPFGAELQVYCLVSAGPFRERIGLGSFMITGVPDISEQRMLWGSRVIHPGQEFTVSLKDVMVRPQRDEFPFPTSPGSTSAWSEIQAVTGMPVLRNVPDATVPRTTSYEGEKSGVVNKLFDLLDAWPHVDASGALTARPKLWPAPVDRVAGVVSETRSMDAERTYNRVVVEGKSPSGAAIFAVAELTEGFLRVRNEDGSVSPFGVQTYRYASDMLTTYQQCLATARSLLPRVSKLRGLTRRIVEPLNPLREIGDVLETDNGLVRIKELSHDDAVTTSVVEVPDE